MFKEVNESVKLILALVIGAGFLWFGIWVNNLRNAAAQNEQRGQTITTTAGIVEDGEKSDAQRVKVEVDVSSAREEWRADIKEAKRNEPETAARADRPVPASVRDAARKRRLARERSVSAESER